MHSSSPKLTSHLIQCNCNQATKPLLSRAISSFFGTQSSESCWRAKQWLSKFPEPNSQVYYDLVSLPLTTASQSLKQIQLDLPRTFPDEPYFSQNSPGREAMRRILIAYCKYDNNLGYAQGMNFIVGSLLWHASEVDAFWLFVALMEDFEMRDIYLPNLPGLYKHCQIIQLVMMEFLPKLHLLFAEHRINCEMYCTEWCFSLFAGVVPVTEMVNVLDNFYRFGWVFFYRFVIALLSYMEDKLLRARDSMEVLGPLKICRKSQKEWKQFLGQLEEGINWKKLIERANVFQIDESYVRYLLFNFDQSNARFKLRRLTTY